MHQPELLCRVGDDLDLEYIKRWADAKSLSDVWLAVLSRCKPH
jgi:hypothetical protein